jgi:hypothetical protein
MAAKKAQAIEEKVCDTHRDTPMPRYMPLPPLVGSRGTVHKTATRAKGIGIRQRFDTEVGACRR